MLKALFVLLLTLTTGTAVAQSTSVITISQAINKHYIDLKRNDGPGCAVGYAAMANCFTSANSAWPI